MIARLASGGGEDGGVLKREATNRLNYCCFIRVCGHLGSYCPHPLAGISSLISAFQPATAAAHINRRGVWLGHDRRVAVGLTRGWDAAAKTGGGATCYM